MTTVTYGKFLNLSLGSAYHSVDYSRCLLGRLTRQKLSTTILNSMWMADESAARGG